MGPLKGDVTASCTGREGQSKQSILDIFSDVYTALKAHDQAGIIKVYVNLLSDYLTETSKAL